MGRVVPKSTTRHPFKTRWYNRRPAFWLKARPKRTSGEHARPALVVLEPETGMTPSAKPAVRIFVGTEAKQSRAERVFIWSVMRVRDRSRRYEIHLMKDLAGIPRVEWTTGFTNYRYTIPSWAGDTGRAIYNDTDQIYLADPAELFDFDLGTAGMASIEQRDNSVMMMDCARMVPFWNLERVRQETARSALVIVPEKEGLWRQLPPEWNSRDGEHPINEVKCFHFTTLYTQPWKPFPEQFRYQRGPGSDVWLTLEREADAAGFQPKAVAG